MTEVYSHNEEDWTYDLDTAVESGKDSMVYDHDRFEIYAGEAEHPTHSRFIEDLGCIIIENMKEWAYEIGDERSEDYLEDLDKTKIEDLEATISKWMEANAKQPNFYEVNKVREYKDYE